jgi:hypothetical protein
MYSYKKWNKTDSINDISSDKWITDTPRMNTEESILIFATNDPQERVSMIFLEGELRQSYNDYTSTIEQLGELKVASLNGSAPGSLIIMQNKIDALIDENKALIENQKAILRGDYQEVAYTLYPKDFEDRVVAN